MLTKQELIVEIKKIVEERYPSWLFQYSESKYSHFRKSYLLGGDWKNEIQISLNHIATLNNFGLFWYDNGVTNKDEIELYKSNRNWNICKICNSIYDRKNSLSLNFRAQNTCSINCNAISRKNGAALLSASKLLYNSRDPVQYAQRHGCSIEDAENIVKNFVLNGAQWCIEYWTNRGYSIQEAEKVISRIQSKNSKRSVAYWVKNGYTEVDAIEKVKEYQSSVSKMKDGFDPEDSWLCMEYYIKRGYSEDEGKILKAAKLLESGEILKRVWAGKTNEEKLNSNPRNLEFYIKRGIAEEVAMKRIAEIYNNSRSAKFVSEISKEFCISLGKHFKDDSLYHSALNKEFFTYCRKKGGIYFYDFTNTTKNFVVEFNGNYWHSEKNKSWTQDLEDAKIDAIENRGFKVFIVWELDYKADKENCVLNLVENIKEWYENCED